MARSADNLTAVLQDTADAIRAKTGSSANICPRDFADEIANIYQGIGVRPYLHDYLPGYVYNNSGAYSWLYEAPGNNRSDFFQVESGKLYFLTLPAGSGNRFRAIFVSTPTPITPMEDVPADAMLVYRNATVGSAQSIVQFTAPSDGVVIVQKSNNGQDNVLCVLAEVVSA